MLKPKNYQKWFDIKTQLHNRNLKSPGLGYREGDIFWVSLGENIGMEEDGKGKLFMRPVLVLRGYSRRFFFGVPLTSQPHSGKYYYPIKIQHRPMNYAILSQAKPLDASRIQQSRKPLGHIDASILRDLKRHFRKLFF